MNQGIFTFQIYPLLFALNRIDFNSAVTFNCDSSYSVSAITFTNGALSIAADYTEDMEEKNCNITVTYDPLVLESPNSTLSLIVQSDNVALLYSSKISQYKQIQFIFEILSFVVLALFVISLPTKVIGV